MSQPGQKLLQKLALICKPTLLEVRLSFSQCTKVHPRCCCSQKIHKPPGYLTYPTWEHSEKSSSRVILAGAGSQQIPLKSADLRQFFRNFSSLQLHFFFSPAFIFILRLDGTYNQPFGVALEITPKNYPMKKENRMVRACTNLSKIHKPPKTNISTGNWCLGDERNGPFLGGHVNFVIFWVIKSLTFQCLPTSFIQMKVSIIWGPNKVPCHEWPRIGSRKNIKPGFIYPGGIHWKMKPIVTKTITPSTNSIA